MDNSPIPGFAFDDLFAKIEANLEKHGDFHVGKCHGKPVSTASGTRGGDGSSRASKERAHDSTAKTTLFESQLPRSSVTTPSKLANNIPIEVDSTEKCRERRAPSPAASVGSSPSIDESPTESKPPAYIPLCVRNKDNSYRSQHSNLSSARASAPSFRPLSWDPPAFDFGQGSSRFASFNSQGGGKKRSREESSQDEFSNTATFKIAAAAARLSEMHSFSYTSGPRFTPSEADDLVSFADRLIPSNDKWAKKSRRK
ncbi:hypothetical protein ACHAXS_005370 [Conticribra weissflogii]